ncbi:uncharacterized protein RHIMIDRAFT_142953 [Rhizopus microsporus ATCC 52813]|uniref:RCC1/BLIP-II protein n=1 Tax=Rhizopus microsporus ATCC 52813 TaxID=1340429 RepID=A0A2G4SU50_RHIZD|nr:uncharacterized protein RHIMIDRAFT_142953 [Rhizopus microsporus ATCC 52813]PHZ12303.1 hypothetical protein RHIMIDRAFT_142953 [Rhizopus microsporus ATCC 52813]
MALLSFGFNGFEQIRQETNITRILFTSWETAIVVVNDEIVVWGYQPDYITPLLNNAHLIQSIFGDPNECMGIITYTNTSTTITPSGKRHDWTDVQDACWSQGSIFVLSTQGVLCQDQQPIVGLPKVRAICGSSQHVLCLTDEGIYGIGSNRFSQLGTEPYQEQQQEPQMIDHFSGLYFDRVSLACGPFHSVVIIDGDVYTFGLSKDGRLGSGDSDSIVDLAVFLDDQGEPVEVNAVKAVCGSCHTLVLDDQGRVWSCGSNKYGQLGRSVIEGYDAYFRQCTSVNQKAIDCSAGRWNSFVLTI